MDLWINFYLFRWLLFRLRQIQEYCSDGDESTNTSQDFFILRRVLEKLMILRHFILIIYNVTARDCPISSQLQPVTSHLSPNNWQPQLVVFTS